MRARESKRLGVRSASGIYVEFALDFRDHVDEREGIQIAGVKQRFFGIRIYRLSRNATHNGREFCLHFFSH